MERYSRLDSETQSYFREVDAHFKTLVEDGSSSEEQEILIGNFFEEIQGREVDIVTDAECSRIVEVLIGHASHAQLKQFAGICIKDDNLGLICTS